MPGLSHFWQRFLMGATLLFGLLVGVAATVFGYSNTSTVTVGWSVWRLSGVPLWCVAIVPLAIVLVVGTLYHWYNSFHHFTEHMRHRRRVHDLEDEVTRLRSHLDHVLEMPGQSGSALPAAGAAEEEPEEAPAETAVATAGGGSDGATPAEPVPVKAEVVAANGSEKGLRKGGLRKKASANGTPAAAAGDMGTDAATESEQGATEEPES